jgi:hypothetical protein
MNKKFKLKSILVLLCASSIVTIASQFVVQKPKVEKALSRSALQESCCQEMGDMLQLIPPVLTQLADAQATSLKQLCGFLQNDKGCFLDKADKTKLAEFDEKMKKLTAYLKEVHQQLNLQVKELRALSLVN